MSLPVSPDSLGDLSTVLLTFVNRSFEVHPTNEYFVLPSATDGHVISHEHGSAFGILKAGDTYIGKTVHT